GLAAALLLLRRNSDGIGVPVVAMAPLGLILVIGLQAVLGLVVYREQATTATLYLLWTTLMIVLGHTLKRELGPGQVVIALAWFVFSGGLLSAVAGMIQHYQVSLPIGFMVAAKTQAVMDGNLGQHNHLGSYVTAALASAVFLHIRG